MTDVQVSFYAPNSKKLSTSNLGMASVSKWPASLCCTSTIEDLNALLAQHLPEHILKFQNRFWFPPHIHILRFSNKSFLWLSNIFCLLHPQWSLHGTLIFNVWHIGIEKVKNLCILMIQNGTSKKILYYLSQMQNRQTAPISKTWEVISTPLNSLNSTNIPPPTTLHLEISFYCTPTENLFGHIPLSDNYP